MARKILIIGLLVMAGATLAAWAVSVIAPTDFKTRTSDGQLTLGLIDGSLQLRRRTSTLDWAAEAPEEPEDWSLRRSGHVVPYLGIRHEYVEAGPPDSTILSVRKIVVPFWLLFVATMAYPLVAWFRGPLRRRRRRSLGLCLACAYDLTGNTSGVCPECGNAK